MITRSREFGDGTGGGSVVLTRDIQGSNGRRLSGSGGGGWAGTGRWAWASGSGGLPTLTHRLGHGARGAILTLTRRLHYS
eukprot:2626299-Prymnesium_polylepis.1